MKSGEHSPTTNTGHAGQAEISKDKEFLHRDVQSVTSSHWSVHVDCTEDSNMARYEHRVLSHLSSDGDNPLCVIGYR